MSEQIVAPIFTLADEALVNNLAAAMIANAGARDKALIAGYGGVIHNRLKPDARLERDFQLAFERVSPPEYYTAIDGMESAQAVAFQRQVAVAFYRQRMSPYGGAR